MASARSITMAKAVLCAVRELPEEEREICLVLTVDSFFPINRFTRFKHITAWVIRFLNNCRKLNPGQNTLVNSLLIPKLVKAENYWISLSQCACFPEEINSLKITISRRSILVQLNPFLDSFGVLRVGGRIGNSKTSYTNLHPIILHGNHSLTRVIIRTEHLRLFHAGLFAELCRRLHIVTGRKTVLRQCIICLRSSIRPQPQKMGQLPMERVT